MQILVYTWFFTVCYNSIVTFEENCKRFISRGTRQLLICGRYFLDYSNCLPKVRHWVQRAESWVTLLICVFRNAWFFSFFSYNLICSVCVKKFKIFLKKYNTFLLTVSRFWNCVTSGRCDLVSELWHSFRSVTQFVKRKRNLRSYLLLSQRGRAMLRVYSFNTKRRAQSFIISCFGFSIGLPLSQSVERLTGHGS